MEKKKLDKGLTEAEKEDMEMLSQKAKEELEKFELKDRIKKLEDKVEILETLCNIYAKSMGIRVEKPSRNSRLIVISQI